MPSPTVPEEVRILRFFETGPMEKVEAVFNIMCEKMRERRGGRSGADVPVQQVSSPKKQPSRTETENPPSENAL